MPTVTVESLASELRLSLSLLFRRFRQTQPSGELTVAESAALARLDRRGPTTPSALAKADQISPQSMGAIVASLEERGLVRRAADPHDGRSVVLSLTAAGRKALHDKRAARTAQISQALTEEFSAEELDLLRAAAPLLERRAQSL